MPMRPGVGGVRGAVGLRAGSTITVGVMVYNRKRLVWLDRRRAPAVFKLAGPMDGAAADVLAGMEFPVQHRARRHSTHPPECLDGESGREKHMSGHNKE